MDATEALGSLAAGALCFLATTLIGMHLVPAGMLAAIVTAALIGTCRRLRREQHD